MNLLEVHARELLGESEAWRVHSYQVMQEIPEPLFSIVGMVAPLKTRGKHKGCPNWRKGDRATEKAVYVTEAAHELWLRERRAKL